MGGPELILPGGGGQMDFVETFNSTTFVTQNALAANAVYFHRVRVSKSITVTEMSVIVTAGAGGNFDLGIYSFDGTTMTRLTRTGSTAASGTAALQTVALATPITLLPGTDYFFAIGVDSATPTYLRITPQGGYATRKNRFLQKAGAWSSGLPATASGFAAGVAVWIEAA